MIAEYDSVDIEAARFRKALLEEVGDPVDALTLQIAAMVPVERGGADVPSEERVVLEGVIEVPESLAFEQDEVASKVEQITNFAWSLGVDARLKVEGEQALAEGRHAAVESQDEGQTALPIS